jgi:hypothetical protein
MRFLLPNVCKNISSEVHETETKKQRPIPHRPRFFSLIFLCLFPIHSFSIFFFFFRQKSKRIFGHSLQVSTPLHPPTPPAPPHTHTTSMRRARNPLTTQPVVGPFYDINRTKGLMNHNWKRDQSLRFSRNFSNKTLSKLTSFVSV